jgi:DNA-binding winged helix-turn-helix (wHTH) protein
MSRVRYRFGDFTVSPARRHLLRAGLEVPLVPRYFDLLVLLLERRNEAVHRRDIFDTVWSDVVVSDGALSQAVRTLRRALGDDPREPAYIRTISRHGYRFVHPGVVEESDDAPIAAAPPPAPPAAVDLFESALQRLLDVQLDMEERREAAEALHALGTEETLRRLDRRPGHDSARALLRDSRFDVPGAGPVPLLGQPGGWTAARMLLSLRLRRALRVAGARWGAASLGGAIAGAVAGMLGGVALRLAPGSQATTGVVVALGFIGALVGGLGAAGVGAGLAAAEVLARSRRGLALVALGAAGGGAVGAIVHLVGGLTLEGVFGGYDLSAVGGGPEGLALGAAAGLGYALTTPRPGGGGMATPHGTERALAALAAGLCCAAAAVALTSLGRHLTAASLNLMARSFRGSQVGLAPLARLLGEPELGPLTRNVLAAYEGFVFGCGVIVGLTRRAREKP